MDPFGWRVSAAVVGALMVLVMCRLVRRLTGSTLLGCIGRPAAAASTGCTSCSPGSRCSTSSSRSSSLCGVALHRRRPRLVPRRGWRARARSEPVTEGWGPSAAALSGPGCVAAGVCLGLAVRHQVDGALPARGVRAAGLAVVGRRPALVRGPLVGPPLGGGRRAYRRSATSCVVGADRLRRELDRLAGATRTSTRSTSPRRSTTFVSGPATARTSSSTRRTTASSGPRATEPDARGLGGGRRSRCGRCGTTTATSTRSTPTS